MDKTEKEIKEDVLLDLLFKLRLDARIYDLALDRALESYMNSRSDKDKRTFLHRSGELAGINLAINRIASALLEDC